MMNLQPEDILSFWRGAGPSLWWKKDASFDSDIADKFGELHSRASIGGLDHWAELPHGALALVIVLDQFSRNMYRNDPRAFAQDERCVQIVKSAMKTGIDRQTPADLSAFFYMPLMHSESLEDQQLCLQEMQRMGAKENIPHAITHLEIIQKFGRFPHRNSVLKRDTTLAERDFLESGGFSG